MLSAYHTVYESLYNLYRAIALWLPVVLSLYGRIGA